MTPTRTRRRSDESRRGIILLFIGLIVALLLAALSQTVLSAAMPTMVGELHGVDQMLWVMTAFMLASTITMPIYGKVSDLVGRKGPLVASILLFMAGSIVGALAPDIGWLIAGRAVQGMGAGGLIILTKTIIADVVPARERGKYIGVMGAVFAVSSIAGPLLGGWITEEVGWRWTFWMNVPLGLIALVAAITLLHLPRRSTARTALDIGGMLTLGGATACLVLLASWAGGEFAWTSPVIIGLGIGMAVLTGLCAFIERRAAEPILPPRLLRDRNFALTTAAGLLLGVTMFGVISYIPTVLQLSFGADPTLAGLITTPMMGAMLVGSLGSGWLISAYGRYKWMPIAGSVVVALALLMLGLMSPATPLWLVAFELGLFGLGLGMSTQLLLLVVQNSVPAQIVGTATAGSNFFRQVGASLGSAVIGSIFTLRVTSIIGERVPESDAALIGHINSLTPERLAQFPPALHAVVADGFNDALAPLLGGMVPLALLSAVLLCFVVEHPLKTTVEPAPETAGGADLVARDDARD